MDDGDWEWAPSALTCTDIGERITSNCVHVVDHIKAEGKAINGESNQHR